MIKRKWRVRCWASGPGGEWILIEDKRFFTWAGAKFHAWGFRRFWRDRQGTKTLIDNLKEQ